jgi:signal transduction histidine kinase
VPFQLVVVDDERRIFPVDGEIVAGRADDCEVSIQDRRLSRRHARFFLEADHLFVEDLGGPNGTFVNGARVGRAELAAGDLVSLGKTQLRVRSSEAPPDPLQPTQIKPVVVSPALAGMRAEDYFQALGLGDETLLEPDARNLARLLRRTRSFAILSEIAKAIQKETDPHEMLQRVLDTLLKVTRAERGHAAVVDDAGQLGSIAIRYREDRKPSGGRVVISQTVQRHVVQGRCAVICADPASDQRFQQSESLLLSEIRSLMAVPIIVGNRVVGLIEIASSMVDRRFDDDDLDLLAMIASTVGVALENLELAKKREETIRALEAAQAELLDAQERLIRSEQLAAIGRFATGIAHEVKNHLSPFMLAELLKKRHPDDPQLVETAEMMLEAQQHILDLVNQIRAFASGASSKSERSPQDLAEVVEAVIRFVQHDPAVKRAKLSAEIESRPVVELDVRSFRQVLINLIRNAGDALKDGRGSIRVRVGTFGERAQVDVIDDGAGVPPEVQERIFEPFFSTKGERGLGLGLDISRKIVRTHGGELTFSSDPGSGTTFSISLPAARLES